MHGFGHVARALEAHDGKAARGERMDRIFIAGAAAQEAAAVILGDERQAAAVVARRKHQVAPGFEPERIPPFQSVDPAKRQIGELGVRIEDKAGPAVRRVDQHQPARRGGVLARAEQACLDQPAPLDVFGREPAPRIAASHRPAIERHLALRPPSAPQEDEAVVRPPPQPNDRAHAGHMRAGTALSRPLRVQICIGSRSESPLRQVNASRPCGETARRLRSE